MFLQWCLLIKCNIRYDGVIIETTPCVESIASATSSIGRAAATIVAVLRALPDKNSDADDVEVVMGIRLKTGYCPCSVMDVGLGIYLLSGLLK